MDDSREVKKKSLKSLLLPVFLLVVGVFVYKIISLYFENFSGELSPKNDDWGTFGDYVGGVLNPVFGLLSFSALLVTISIQSKELKEAREQFSRSADAQEKSEKVMQLQAVTLIRQQFESTFFSLLEQHNRALESISRVSSTTGASPVDLAHDEIFDWDNINLESAKKTMDGHDENFGHYFRTLYQLLKYLCVCIPDSDLAKGFSVDALEVAPLKPGEKMYSNIIRSFIRSDIAQLLAVNCFCSSRSDQYYKFKVLVERYSLLEHMPFDVQGNRDQVLLETADFYSSSAFGESDYLRRVKEAV